MTDPIEELERRIITTLLRHGPLCSLDLADLIDPNRTYAEWTDDNPRFWMDLWLEHMSKRGWVVEGPEGWAVQKVLALRSLDVLL